MNYRTALLKYFRQRDRAWILSLFMAVCIVYLPFLGNPFFFDDLPFFSGDVAEGYAHSQFHFDPRWLPYASLGWTYAIFSDVNTYFFHLGNLLLHAGNVILLFYLLRQLVGAAIAEDEKSPAIIWGAWFGALVFAFHPVAVYAAGYIVQRTILMATLFVLVMQLAYVKGLLTGQRRWLILAVIAYFLAAFSKEHSVMVPAVLAALTILLRDKNKLDRRSLALCWGAFIVIAVLLILSAKGVIGTVYEPTATTQFEQQGVIASTAKLHLLSIFTQAGLFFKYLILWIVPNPAWMSIDMRETFIASLGAWQGWAGMLGFIAYGIFSVRLLLRPRWTGLIGLALLYPWLLFMVEFSSIRMQEIFVLYRSYLWMPGLMLFFPWLLSRFPGRGTWLALGCLVLLLLPLSWNRLWVFADNYRMWNDAAKLLPSEQAVGADRIFFNRGHAATVRGKWQEAMADYERVVARNPEIAVVHHDLGVTYFNTKRYQDAIVQFDLTISLDPEYAKAYFDKGMALKYLHEDDLAMQQIKKSCELKYAIACVIVILQPPKK